MILLGIAIYLTVDCFKAKAELRQAQEEYEELKRELIFKMSLRRNTDGRSYINTDL